MLVKIKIGELKAESELLKFRLKQIDSQIDFLNKSDDSYSGKKLNGDAASDTSKAVKQSFKKAIDDIDEMIDDVNDSEEPSELDHALDDDTGPDDSSEEIVDEEVKPTKPSKAAGKITHDDIRARLKQITTAKGSKAEKQCRDILAKATKGTGLVKDIPASKLTEVNSALSKV